MSIGTVGLSKRIEILKQVPPFNLLNDEQLNKVAESLIEETYPAGTYVGRQGETSRMVLFIVVEGKVEITVTDKQGNETIIGYRDPLEFLGETVFLSGNELPASGRALENTKCFLLPQESFDEIVIENPEFASYFTRLLTERLRILYQRFYDEEEASGESGFSKRVSDIMVTDVVTCLPQEEAHKIATLMDDYNVSSVVVVDEENTPLGIITEGDLVSKVLRDSVLSEGAQKKARELMSKDLISVKPYDFTYQAFLHMVKNRITHVVVRDEEDKLMGIVAMRDLIKSRKTGSLAVVNRIESCDSVEELTQVRDEVDQVLQALLVERATVMEITSLITEFYDRITRKIIQISERDMVEEGYGPPPVGYCWLSMGSSGRKEQFARTDQDNGIIYEEVSPEREEEVKNYFLTLGEKVVSGLERYGFARCKGDVMANNEMWCQSFRGWRNTINIWLSSLDMQTVRNMTIFLDFRFVYGRINLAELLRNFVLRNFRTASVALNFLVDDNLSKKIPLNIFRQIQTERSGEYKDHLNLKTTACVHIVDCARVFALREGIRSTNTIERLKEVSKKGILKEKDVEYIVAAYETLMMLRIRDAMAKMRRGQDPDNYINPKELSNREYSLLKEALVMVSRLQSITANHFRIVP